MEKPIYVFVTIRSSMSKVWAAWTMPKHIVKWNTASGDWHTVYAECEPFSNGGYFLFRMEAKDGSAGFDFKGTYTDVDEKSKMEYVLEDGRKVETIFLKHSHNVIVKTLFEAENENPRELQEQGWQAILNNFKKYVESI